MFSVDGVEKGVGPATSSVPVSGKFWSLFQLMASKAQTGDPSMASNTSLFNADPDIFGFLYEGNLPLDIAAPEMSRSTSAPNTHDTASHDSVSHQKLLRCFLTDS
jgi:hypothetical protein